jgi:Signal peptidase, peptidase S26
MWQESGVHFPVPIRVPAGHWFLMGDNRGESIDSRFWGAVPTGWILGAVTQVISKQRTRTIVHEAFRKRALASAAACLRKAGVDVPTSHSALLSSTSGIKTHSTRVKAAISRCRNESPSASAR